MPINLSQYHKNCHTAMARSQDNTKLQASDRSFTSLSALERRQWSDLMGFPCAQTRMQMSSLLAALLAFKTSESMLYGGNKTQWGRSWISVVIALLTFFSLHFLQELRQ